EGIVSPISLGAPGVLAVQLCPDCLVRRRESLPSFERLFVSSTGHLVNLYCFIKFLHRLVSVSQELVNPAHRFVRARKQGTISFSRSRLYRKTIIGKCVVQSLSLHILVGCVRRSNAPGLRECEKDARLARVFLQHGAQTRLGAVVILLPQHVL